MTMKLTLAVTLECLPEECRVQLLESDTPITVHYSTRVKANPSLKIRPGQLVALNTATDIPEVVYRWHYSKVEQLKEDKVLIDNHQGQLIELVLAEGFEAAPQVGDWVFVTIGGNPGQSEVVDIAIDGRPAHPAFFGNYFFPRIEQMYQETAGKS